LQSRKHWLKAYDPVWQVGRPAKKAFGNDPEPVYALVTKKPFYCLNIDWQHLQNSYFKHLIVLCTVVQNMRVQQVVFYM